MAFKEYRLIEHTADIGVIVEGKDKKELFINAAKAVFDLIASPINPPTKKKEIDIETDGKDIEDVFANWLNELISLSSAKSIIFFDFSIEELSEKWLSAKAFASPLSDYTLKAEIKAATRHGLEIKHTADNKWQASIIFDV